MCVSGVTLHAGLNWIGTSYLTEGFILFVKHGSVRGYMSTGPCPTTIIRFNPKVRFKSGIEVPNGRMICIHECHFPFLILLMASWPLYKFVLIIKDFSGSKEMKGRCNVNRRVRMLTWRDRRVWVLSLPSQYTMHCVFPHSLIFKMFWTKYFLAFG